MAKDFQKEPFVPVKEVVSPKKPGLTVKSESSKQNFTFDLDTAATSLPVLLSFIIENCERIGIVMHDTTGIGLQCGVDAFCTLLNLGWRNTGIPINVGTNFGLSNNEVRVCNL